MKTRLVLGSALLVLILAGCASPSSAPTATPQPDQLSSTATSAPPTETPVPLDGRGGGRIVFASKRDENYDIYVMNADGSGQRRLTFHLAEDTMPSWSPSGTQIAFTSDRSGRFKIYVMNADGSGLRQLTHDYGWGPSWSPDGSMIAFTRYSPYSAIFVMNANGRDERQLVPAIEGVSYDSPKWSPDGTRMLCVLDTNTSADDFERHLTINILDLNDLLQGTGEATYQALPRPGESVNDRPSWSPDGTRIAFSARAGNHRDLYLVNPDGTNLQQLTLTDELDEFSPTWSPDGTRIAFQMNTSSGWDIYSMRVDGTDLQRLTTDFANDVAPSWVP